MLKKMTKIRWEMNSEAPHMGTYIQAAEVEKTLQSISAELRRLGGTAYMDSELCNDLADEVDDLIQ